MTAGYVIGLVLVAAAALLVTSFALRRWERTSTAAVDRPWWLTWRRVALLNCIVFAFGALGMLSGFNLRGVWPMAFFCYAVLPVTYNTIGFGVRGFRLEQFFLWAVWLGGSVLAGGDVQEAGKYALVGLLMCVTFGAVITKLGVRNAWTWERIWKRQT